MEKTFVDFYLIDDYQTLVSEYNNLERLSQLNVFELCLLIDSLIKSGKSQDAKRLAELIRTQKDAWDNIDVEKDNKIFDIVLNLNMLKVNPGDGGAPSFDPFDPFSGVSASGGYSAGGGGMNAANFSAYNDFAGM